ncbi:MAG: DUF5715 family protein [Gemmatimonadota bacterium]
MVQLRHLIPAPALLVITFLVLAPGEGVGQTLRGSQASLDRQNHQARSHDFTYLRTSDQVRRFVAAGYLVELPGNADYRVHNVSFPYARPEVKTFVERLSRQYRSACGEQLVVTSATRPQSHQPRNASSRSVHPTGMALDLRVPQNPRCRSWLESTLMSLEGRGVVEAIRERRPPHYHLAIYPQPYARYVAQMTGSTRLAEASETNGTDGGTNARGAEAPSAMAVTMASATSAGADPDGQAPHPWEVIRYRVRSGESLWTIARTHGVTVESLQGANGLRGSRIVPGQLLEIPVTTGNSTLAAAATPVQYRVRRGDSLWTIARAHGVTVDRIRAENELRNSRIYAGQLLTLPLSP